MTVPVLATVAIVMGAVMLGGRVARLLRQPAVVGEMLVGIALGPSLLGWAGPQLSAHLLPVSSRSLTGTLADMGVAVLVFLVGADLRVGRSSGRTVGAITVGSVGLPVLLGTTVALALPSPVGVPRWASVLTVGTALSVTAVPVLALILAEYKLAQSIVGVTSLAAAGASDAFAWSLLVIVSAAAGSQTSPRRTIVLVMVLSATVVLVRVGLLQLERRWRLATISPVVLTGGVAVLSVLGAALSQAAGLHTVVGSLAVGLAVPRSPELARTLERLLGAVARLVFLPFFFLTVGMSVDLTDLASPVLILALLSAAVIGKVAGAAVPARLTQASWRDSLRLGILLNTRGLTELVFLAGARQANLIGSEVYTSLVVVALVTTVATGPLLQVITGCPRIAARPMLPRSSAPRSPTSW